MHKRFGLSALATIAIAAIITLMAVDYAEARRGGGFGSRGARTFDAPAPTRTAPDRPGNIDRSMTPRQQAQPSAARQTPAQGAQRGMFGGMMGGLLGGLMLGGLIGLLLGNGLGGLAGLMGLLLQVGIVILVVMLVMRFLRSRRQPAAAGPGNPYAANSGPQSDTFRREPVDAPAAARPGAYGTGASAGGAGAAATAHASTSAGGDDIGLTEADYDAFEQLLVEVQAAFTREDYAALRRLCTPEIVSYLSEELSQNAVAGKRNDVTDVSLLQGDLSEAWQEGDREYATVAMRYQSVDVMRDRNTGEAVEGVERPTETTEIWTFVRPVGGSWQLSAIQDT